MKSHPNPNLDPAPDPRDSADTPQDNEPDEILTPEGDNESSFDLPLHPDPEDEEGLQTPPGSAPSSVDQDK
jgi:hypothetical protein